MSDPLLSLDRVTYTYPGAEAPALREVSLDIHPGSSACSRGYPGRESRRF